MTVVEKIIQLCDERLSILTYGKIYCEERARLDPIEEKLDTIRRTCPRSWEAAERILHGPSSETSE